MRDNERSDVLQFSALSCLANEIVLFPVEPKFDSAFMHAWDNQQLSMIYPNAGLGLLPGNGKIEPGKLIQRTSIRRQFQHTYPSWKIIYHKKNGNNICYYSPTMFDNSGDNFWVLEYLDSDNKMEWIQNRWFANNTEELNTFVNYWMRFGDIMKQFYNSSEN